MLARLARATTAKFTKKLHWTLKVGHFFLLCCLRAGTLCLAPDGFEPAPMEKEGVGEDPDCDRGKGMIISQMLGFSGACVSESAPLSLSGRCIFSPIHNF